MELSGHSIPREILHHIFQEVDLPESQGANLVCKMWYVTLPKIKGVRNANEFVRSVKRGDHVSLIHPKYEISLPNLNRMLRRAAKRGHRRVMTELLLLGANDLHTAAQGACEGAKITALKEIITLIEIEDLDDVTKIRDKPEYAPLGYMCAYYAFKSGDTPTIHFTLSKIFGLSSGKDRNVESLEFTVHLWCLYAIAWNGKFHLLELLNYGKYGTHLFFRQLAQSNKPYNSKLIDTYEPYEEQYKEEHVHFCMVTINQAILSGQVKSPRKLRIISGSEFEKMKARERELEERKGVMEIGELLTS